MATGRLGAVDISAATWTTLYTVPSTTFTVLNMSVVNRSNASVAIRVAVSTSTTPGNSEYIEYGATIDPSGVLERTGIVLDAGKNLLVYCSTANVSFVAWGIETPTV
jgi:hypothetical protein